ncbi:MAG: glucose-1-phosphate thymidylyltransferase [Muribaculaceae bacterium]|nr:glucose-1-phosphate thymidylyltransferase [Muribaculaceae bacterium]
MKIYLFDSLEAHENLLPLSFTRPLADFRCGILTLREKWERYIPGDYQYLPVEYLQGKFGPDSLPDEEALFIAGNLLPRTDIVSAINELAPGNGISWPSPYPERKTDNDKKEKGEISPDLIAFRGTISDLLEGKAKVSQSSIQPSRISFSFDVFLKNGEEIIRDFQLITKGRRSKPLPPCVRKISSPGLKGRKRLIFIEEGAQVECSSINLSKGPVYIGRDAVLMEGSNIRGPFALCESAEVKMGAKIYEGTTVGPHCKVGGELSNAVIFGYSNKAHDGFLGNAVVGEWCNIGAGTNASNLKNDYSLIRVWNYALHSFMRTDLQFCGLIMGDHSKIGVNCMINTATVIGVGVNIHGAGFPRNFVPCFCEGSPVTGFSHVPLKKFLDTASRVMSRRDLSPSPEYISLLSHIYDVQSPQKEN